MAYPRYSRRKLDKMIAEHTVWGPKKAAERLRYMALALCGEVGEFSNLIKKEWRGDLNRMDKAARAAHWQKLYGEFADIGAYWLIIGHLLKADALPCVYYKMKSVEARPHTPWSTKRKRNKGRR